MARWSAPALRCSRERHRRRRRCLLRPCNSGRPDLPSCSAVWATNRSRWARMVRYRTDVSGVRGSYLGTIAHDAAIGDRASTRNDRHAQPRVHRPVAGMRARRPARTRARCPRRDTGRPLEQTPLGIAALEGSVRRLPRGWPRSGRGVRRPRSGRSVPELADPAGREPGGAGVPERSARAPAPPRGRATASPSSSASARSGRSISSRGSEGRRPSDRRGSAGRLGGSSETPGRRHQRPGAAGTGMSGNRSGTSPVGR
jgi:hypothetical protein